MNPYKANKIHNLAQEYAKDVIAHFNIGNVRGIRVPTPRSRIDLISFMDEVQKCVNDIVGEDVIEVEVWHRTTLFKAYTFENAIAYFPYGERPNKKEMNPFHELHDIKEELSARDRYDNELRALSRERSKGKI